MSNKINFKSASKKSMFARKDKDGKLLKSLANYGAKKGDVTDIKSKGEYYKFSVEWLEDVVPIFTVERIKRMIKALEENDIYGAMDILHVRDLIKKESNTENILYYVITKWLKYNNLSIPTEYVEKSKNVKDNNPLSEYILRLKHHPINKKFKIVNAGQNTKTKLSVVPESWVGRKFDNAKELHSEMDELPERANKPPVTHCCTYRMSLIDKNIWYDMDELKITDLKNISFILNVQKDLRELIVWKKSEFEYVSDQVGSYRIESFENLNFMIICDLDEFFILSKDNINPFTGKKVKQTVSVLVSMLQKSIRRGQSCYKILTNTIINLNNARPYNVPNFGFVKTSGTGRLLWRLFVTIVEDVIIYKSETINMFDLICLSSVTFYDADLKLNDKYLEKVLSLALQVQKINEMYDWRQHPESKLNIQKTLSSNSVHNYEPEQLSLFLALSIFPSMSVI